MNTLCFYRKYLLFCVLLLIYRQTTVTQRWIWQYVRNITETFETKKQKQPSRCRMSVQSCFWEMFQITIAHPWFCRNYTLMHIASETGSLSRLGDVVKTSAIWENRRLCKMLQYLCHSRSLATVHTFVIYFQRLDQNCRTFIQQMLVSGRISERLLL